MGRGWGGEKDPPYSLRAWPDPKNASRLELPAAAAAAAPEVALEKEEWVVVEGVAGSKAICAWTDGGGGPLPSAVDLRIILSLHDTLPLLSRIGAEKFQRKRGTGD